MARLDLPAGDQMTPEQSAVCNEAIAGRRGKVPAPMIAWLQNPELARRAQKVGELLRFETTLSARESELAILICGRHWVSHHEWTAHKALALAAGLPEAVIADVAAGRVPAGLGPREAVIHEVSAALLGSRRLGDDPYRRGVDVLGERGMVELVGILGYYCMVSLTLNAFELGLPDNRSPDLAEAERELASEE